MKVLALTAFAATVLLVGCNSSSQSKPVASQENVKPSVVHGITIEAVPSQFSAYSKAGYNRHVAVNAPNGKSIHILIMDRLSDYQIVKAVNVLNHYLTPVDGTKYGSADSKRDIANAMANNGAILKLMNYHDEPQYNDDLDGQPLFEEEIQVEGGEWYVRQGYEEHRDASYEEILHLVHDYGIGVLNSPQSGESALPLFQKELNTIQTQALHLQLTLWKSGKKKSVLTKSTLQPSLIAITGFGGRIVAKVCGGYTKLKLATTFLQEILTRNILLNRFSLQH